MFTIPSSHVFFENCSSTFPSTKSRLFNQESNTSKLAIRLFNYIKTIFSLIKDSLLHLKGPIQTHSKYTALFNPIYSNKPSTSPNNKDNDTSSYSSEQTNINIVSQPILGLTIPPDEKEVEKTPLNNQLSITIDPSLAFRSSHLDFATRLGYSMKELFQTNKSPFRNTLFLEMPYSIKNSSFTTMRPIQETSSVPNLNVIQRTTTHFKSFIFEFSQGIGLPKIIVPTTLFYDNERKPHLLIEHEGVPHVGTFTLFFDGNTTLPCGSKLKSLLPFQYKKKLTVHFIPSSPQQKGPDIKLIEEGPLLPKVKEFLLLKDKPAIVQAAPLNERNIINDKEAKIARNCLIVAGLIFTGLALLQISKLLDSK